LQICENYQNENKQKLFIQSLLFNKVDKTLLLAFGCESKAGRRQGKHYRGNREEFTYALIGTGKLLIG
jgi:hypothetical protein